MSASEEGKVVEVQPGETRENERAAAPDETPHSADEPVSYAGSETAMTSNATRSWETITPYVEEETLGTPEKRPDEQEAEAYGNAEDLLGGAGGPELGE
ncbi:MAG: hypothetical protein KY468_21105 [Armatimonadetes bacterium]|nr:hypothetical protein [Armatimonadota bacterium]